MYQVERTFCLLFHCTNPSLEKIFLVAQVNSYMDRKTATTSTKHIKILD